LLVPILAGAVGVGANHLSDGMHSIGCPALTPKQVKKSLSLLKGRYRWRNRALVTLGIRTGLRISELLALRVVDVVTPAGTRERIYVARRNTKGKNHGASIILHPQAAKAIAKWISVRRNVDPEDWLFPSQMRPDRALGRKSAWAILHRAFIAAGVEGMAGTHCLRKTGALRIYKALKGDIFRLSIALRHSSPLTTMAYLSFRQEEIDRAILRA
jgi:integrase